MLKIDQKDHEIIGILRDDSRISIRDIAKKTGIRPSTVHERIKKLKQEGVIEKFTLKLNNKAIGENFIVFVLVQTEENLPSTIFKNKNIKEAFGVTGEHDLILKLKFKDIEEFNDFILDFRKKYNLRKTSTMVVTANIKEEI